VKVFLSREEKVESIESMMMSSMVRDFETGNLKLAPGLVVESDSAAFRLDGQVQVQGVRIEELQDGFCLGGSKAGCSRCPL